MAGNLLLGGGLTTALAAMAICFAQKIPSARPVKICAAVSAIFITAASLLLWILIFENDFSVEYVAAYSSTTLPTIYKVSAFWAGQQGSFLLWLLIHAIIGAVLTFRRTQAAALGIYFLVQSILVLLVLAKTPFAEHPAQVLEGVGLNPLLQDFWMAIHPPIIFVGYALLAVPFALSLGSLLTEAASQRWLEEARKWTLAAWAFLGAGIFIGGYWAYKVLGWGGYWGWDPVENSSLVPWILAAVLLHLINLARKKSAVLAQAHVAATFTYSLVIYGTFLTRSGILGDFSVHSFAGSNIGMAIALANALVLIGGLAIIFVKAKEFPQGELYKSYGEASFIILLSCLLLIFIATIVWIGMSMPLLTQLVGEAAAVDSDFYVKSISPIALTLAALMIYTFVKFGRMLSLGGKVAHVGFLAMLAAIVISAQGETVTQELQPRAKVLIAGHEVIYEGQVFQEEERQKFYVYTVDGEVVRALTKLHGNGTDAAREPAIMKNFSGDVYIAPHAPTIENVQELMLTKGLFAMDGELGYIFDDAHIDYDDNNQPIQATAAITITDGEVEEVIHPLITVTADGGSSQALEVFNGKRRVRLTGISGDLNKARLEILPTLEKLSSMPITVTVSTKPFIWLLWLSVTIICLGTLLAIKKFGRRRENVS
ncbi:MAG: cytochrome c biogenesis protein CcsA [Selenomonadaceae bacterium]|nr:cytochrome c biogenesis protein CcsA [Selenomonadaceae bacterium]